jgi:hypothetical protein
MNNDKSKKIEQWWMTQNVKATLRVILWSAVIIIGVTALYYLLWPVLLSNLHLF